MRTPETRVAPLYQRVKSYIIEKIRAGTWKPLERIPSEHELVRRLGASRMTVNRALRELATEGHLTRLAGVGTFVARPRPKGHLLKIQNIADEIRAAGGFHHAKVVQVCEQQTPPEIALALQIEAEAAVYRSVIVHYADDLPLQLEDRFVRPAVAPGYLSVDFAKTTPNEYLLEVAPLEEVEHEVQAIMPASHIRQLLAMAEDEPCLLLRRRTWSRGVVASTARLYYPGSRYQLGERFPFEPETGDSQQQGEPS